jgi:uncharacterized membrane protein YqaE (UPF0057 family)
MYLRIRESLEILALALFAPLVVTTARFFLGVEFPFDLLLVSLAFVPAFIFIRRAETRRWQSTYLIGAIVMVMQTIGLMFAVAGLRFSFLISGEMWIASVSAWLLLAMCVSLGTLLGKESLKPVTS